MQDDRNEKDEAVVAGDLIGARLDRAAALLWPGEGLRGRRRRIEAGGLLVNGRQHGPAYRVRAGEILAAVALTRPEGEYRPEDVAVLVRGEAYGAVSKPAGLHSATIAHGGGQSLEDLLPALFPDRGAWLLSRLDRLTSGLVPVAFSLEAATAYRSLEDAGEVAKTYLAVVHGVISEPFVVDFRLDTADRAKSRVRFRTEPDCLRHTQVTPLETRGGLTLVGCRIAKGARHQIRAHLAAAGHPLVGDPVYGRGEGERLYLHCARLTCPALVASDEPAWTLTHAARAAEKKAREKNANRADGKSG